MDTTNPAARTEVAALTLKDEAALLARGSVIYHQRARLSTEGRASDRRYVFEGPSGRHTLLVESTDLPRLNAHWVSFAGDARNRWDAHFPGYSGELARLADYRFAAETVARTAERTGRATHYRAKDGTVFYSGHVVAQAGTRLVVVCPASEDGVHDAVLAAASTETDNEATPGLRFILAEIAGWRAEAITAATHASEPAEVKRAETQAEAWHEVMKMIGRVIDMQ